MSDIMSDVLDENVGHEEENVGHVRQKTVFHVHCVSENQIKASFAMNTMSRWSFYKLG